ncbi:MAG: hypothetical protein H7330_13560 [Hymenobacteraceae bacterium]|nr:hypothetical protein [Hymenobacteraceae bacterium]
MPPLPASAAPSLRPRAAWWLTGAAALALAVQAIFLFVPEPKSAGATDPGAPEVTPSGPDSTAFTLPEDPTVLPTEQQLAPDSTALAPTTADSSAVAVPALPAPSRDSVAPVSADSAGKLRPASLSDSTNPAYRR